MVKKTQDFPNWQDSEGSLDPLGVAYIPEENAWNFVLCSKHASGVTLLLYSDDSYGVPVREVVFNRFKNKSGPLWHCRIKDQDLKGARYYAYRVEGPQEDCKGSHAFDPDKVLFDPYAKALFFPPDFDRATAKRPGPNAGKAPLGLIRVDEDFNWESDHPLHHGADLVIYEMHVRGFTKDPSSEVKAPARGTYQGVIEKIPYLKELGVTAVELMPVFQFDPQENNYWGYMTLNFFSPHGGYAETKDPALHRSEFRRMVRELHKAGIEVILDVVYNHTVEGDETGPTYSYKGIDNHSYYIQSGDPSSPYANFTGCGNTLDPHNPAVRKLVTDSLAYWREEMHVDGFRFDLASIFSRNSDGSVNDAQPPIFGQISSQSGALNMRRIAEPWDAAGTHQLGRAFPGWLWMQWNGRYRDAIQSFVRGEPGLVSELITRLYGSSDLFPDSMAVSCRPWQSVNYISSHDGSSLCDLVTYKEKYNWANGENNRDGCYEDKWNCGYEGENGAPETTDVLRRRQVKNFFALLLLSNGSPMFRMGDEFFQTQGGNNNPYNQDNETSWLNWHRLKDNRDIFNFVKQMIAFRKANPTVGRSHFWRDDVTWYGVAREVDYTESSQALAYHLKGGALQTTDLYVMINGSDLTLEFGIHAGVPGSWTIALDTSRPSPQDILPEGKRAMLSGYSYTVANRSVVVLVSKG